MDVVQCYMVRAIITPDLLGRSYVETYFLAKSDQDAVKDSFSHAVALINACGLRVLKLEVFDCHLDMLLGGMNQGGIDRILYDSDNLTDSIVKERPEFIG